MCDRELRDNVLSISSLHCQLYAYTQGKSTESALLIVNPNKMELVILTNNRTLGNYTSSTLANNGFQSSTQDKYFGVTLNHKLNWDKHVTQKLNKARIIFCQCRKLIGKKWGLSPKIILRLYTPVGRLYTPLV